MPPLDRLQVFYQTYLDAFATADPTAMTPLFEYPWLVTKADAVHQVADAAAGAALYGAVFDGVRERDWARTVADEVRVFPMGEDGGLIIADYSRLRADGSVIERGRTAYVMCWRGERWRITGMVDELGHHPDQHLGSKAVQAQFG